MLNTDAVAAISRHRGDAVVIVTMTTIFTWPDAADDDLCLRCAPLMGGASQIGLGIALGRPDRNVLVLDGDGSLIMQMGALTTIAEAAPPNLFHFVFNNGLLYEGGGRVPTANGSTVDFVGLARAAGYPATQSFDDAAELEAALPALLEQRGPMLIRLGIEPPATPPWSNENPHGELPDWWFTMMREDATAMAVALRR